MPSRLQAATQSLIGRNFVDGDKKETTIVIFYFFDSFDLQNFLWKEMRNIYKKQTQKRYMHKPINADLQDKTNSERYLHKSDTTIAKCVTLNLKYKYKYK